jgi:hypothetical protein
MENAAAPLCWLTTDYLIVGGFAALLLLCLGFFGYWVGLMAM